MVAYLARRINGRRGGDGEDGEGMRGEQVREEPAAHDRTPYTTRPQRPRAQSTVHRPTPPAAAHQHPYPHSAHDQRDRGGSARGRYPRPLCPCHVRNEAWWQVPVARDVFVTVIVTRLACSTMRDVCRADDSSCRSHKFRARTLWTQDRPLDPPAPYFPFRVTPFAPDFRFRGRYMGGV